MKRNLIILAILALIFSSCASRVKEPVFNFQGKMLHLVELNRRLNLLHLCLLKLPFLMVFIK